MPLFRSLPAESTIRRIASGSIWTFAGTGLSSVASLLTSIMCSRQLGLEGFGRLSALVSTIGLCALFGVLGMGLTATKFVAEHRASDRARTGRIIAMLDCITALTCTFGATFLIAGSRWLSSAFFRDPLLSPYLKLGVIWLAGLVVNEIAMAILAGFEAFLAIAVGQLLRGVVLIAGTWIGLRFWGPLGAVWGLIASVIVAAVFFRIQVRKLLHTSGIRRDYRGIPSELNLIWRYSIPAVLSGIVVLPFVFSANGVIARHLGMRELGLVSAIVQWRGVLTFLPVNLAKVALAVFASKPWHEDPTSHSFQVSNWFNQILLWPIALFLLFAARRILALNGHDFMSGVVVHQIMIGATALGYVGNSIGTVIQARGWFRIGIAGNLLNGLSIGLCTWALVGRVGAGAMSWGYFVGNTVSFLLCGYLVTRRKALSTRLWTKMQIAGLSMVGAMAVAYYFRGNCSWTLSAFISLSGMLFATLLFAPASVVNRLQSVYATRRNTAVPTPL